MSGVDVNIAAIREAFCTVLKASGALERKINIYPRHPGAPKDPSLIIAAGSPYMTFHETWGTHGVLIIRFRLELYAANPRANDSLIILDELLSFGPSQPSSIPNVLRADRTLGGVVSKVHVREAEGPSPLDGGADAALLVDVEP